MYTTQWDGSSLTSIGTQLQTIGVSKTNDFTTVTFVGTPFPAGWTAPSVSYDGGVFHMVARNSYDNDYYYIRGTAPDQFDFANAENLHLAQYQGSIGAWDNLRYGVLGPSGAPIVASARVVAGQLYIFYIAGIPLGNFSTIPEGRFGLGVLRRAVQ